MKVSVSNRANAAARRIDERWKRDAAETTLFADELALLVERLETSVTTPGIASPTQRHPGLRRVLLPKSRCHVYLKLVGEVVRILEIWDARRGRTPKL